MKYSKITSKKKNKAINCNVSKKIRKKYNTKSISIKVGDRVRITKGSFKGHYGKIIEVCTKRNVAYIENVTHIKKKNSLIYIPVSFSNITIIDLFIEKKRKLIFKNHNNYN
nr:60S ribosomal protein L26 [Cryptomonas paramecium]